MNRKQRMKNRDTAKWLQIYVPPDKQCERCGEWVHKSHYGGGIIGGEFVGGWWCAPKADEVSRP